MADPVETFGFESVPVGSVTRLLERKGERLGHSPQHFKQADQSPADELQYLHNGAKRHTVDKNDSCERTGPMLCSYSANTRKL